MDPQTVSQHAENSEPGRVRLNESVRNSCSKVEQCVHDNPQTALLISLGAGLGLGIVIGAMLGTPQRSNRWFERRTAERLGHRMMAQMGNLLPTALSDRLSS